MMEALTRVHGEAIRAGAIRPMSVHQLAGELLMESARLLQEYVEAVQRGDTVELGVARYLPRPASRLVAEAEEADLSGLEADSEKPGEAGV